MKALRELHPEISTVIVNVNDKRTSMVLGDKESVIYGKGYIEDTLCGCTFRISPKSFYQVNPVQTELLYGKAIAYAALTGNETVVDAYCGTGTIGIIAAKSAKKVIGVELNRDAVRDAVKNAKCNNVKNIDFTTRMRDSSWWRWQNTVRMRRPERRTGQTRWMSYSWIRRAPEVTRRFSPLW